ncbi:hypothetical protein TCAL_03684 [Tigriopus californicus]|uniref:C-type lectin domain-containing protein n=1 Tax=Tigriopus californicus TaxID=6832 RepID=A0A553N9Q3_TIGCA|nr:hypothetical protein TCAL_03684 [Tigriopus californicus]
MRSGVLILVLGQALAIYGAHHIRTGTASIEDFQSFFSSDVEPKGQNQASRQTAPQDTSSNSNSAPVTDSTNRNTKSNSFGSQGNGNDNSRGSPVNRNTEPFRPQANRNIDKSFEFPSNRNDNVFRSQENRQDNSFGSQGNRNEDSGFGRTDDDFYWQQLGGLEEFDSNVFYNWDNFGQGSSSGKAGNNPSLQRPNSGFVSGGTSEEFDDDDDEEIEDEEEQDEEDGEGHAQDVEQRPSKGQSWKKARDFCLNRCMDLAAIESPKEDDFIASHLERAKYVEGAWIGARLCFSEPDCPKNSHWYWVSSKKKLPQTGSWSRTGGLGDPQPDNLCQYYGGPKEECGAMLNNWFRDGVRWHDLACAQRLGFVCEVKVTSSASKSSRQNGSIGTGRQERSQGRGSRRTTPRQEIRNGRNNRNRYGAGRDNQRSRNDGRGNDSARNRYNKR